MNSLSFFSFFSIFNIKKVATAQSIEVKVLTEDKNVNSNVNVDPNVEPNVDPNVDVEPTPPNCPCFDRTSLIQFQKAIIANEAYLVKGSCRGNYNSGNNNNGNSEASLMIHYLPPIHNETETEVEVEVETEVEVASGVEIEMETESGETVEIEMRGDVDVIQIVEEEIQVINPNSNANSNANNGNANTTPPPINKTPPLPPGVDPKQFDHGWVAETFHNPTDNVTLGHCIQFPSHVAFGPHPAQNITSCQMYIQDTCNMIEMTSCPCYGAEQVLKIKEKIERYNQSGFILDVEKSCRKDSDVNGGLPYGIYRKRVQVEIENSHGHGIGGHGQYVEYTDRIINEPPILFDDDLKMGISTRSSPHTGTECYDGTDAVRPNLNHLQSTHCTNLIDYICASLELPPTRTVPAPTPTAPTAPTPVTPTTPTTPVTPTAPAPAATPASPPTTEIECHRGRCWDSDEVNYNFRGKEGKTCAHMTRSERRRKRNCRKYDSLTDKFLFEHCRKSCGATTCKNDESFFYNGQEGLDCDWIGSQNHTEYCVDETVAKYCRGVCGTNCCTDNEDFVFRYKERNNLKCTDVRKILLDENGNNDGTRDGKNICRLRRIANNCKMACLKCPIQPRNG